MKEYELSPATQKLLDKAFRSHPENQDQTMRMEAIKEKATQFVRYLMKLTPECEEQRKIVECIREAQFWAAESIKKNEA